MGSPRFERAGSVLFQLELAVMEANIRECYRLENFKVGSTHPLLHKLNILVDVNSVVSGRYILSTSPDVRIKPDLTLDRRKMEQLLLLERKSLTRSGREHIGL